MKKKTIAIISAIAVALVVTLAAGSRANNTNDGASNNLEEMEPVRIGSNISLMVPILNVENPERDIEVLSGHLMPGDIVVFPPNTYQQVSELKREIGGLEIGTGGITTATLLPGIQRIPADVEYVTYDYERDFTPEWSTDQGKSSEYFKELYEESHKHNKKLVVVPVFVFGQDWDWGEVAKNTDILVVQVQNFQTDARVPDSIKPAALGMDLVEVTRLLVDQVNAKSPSTKLYLQLGFEVTDDPANVLMDIERIKDLGIDGITLWYNPGTSEQTSKIHLLQSVMDKLERTR